LKNPQLEYSPAGQNHILTLDAQQQLELKVTLSPDNLKHLKQNCPSDTQRFHSKKNTIIK